jgi:FAD/FMN-containing dehydrogenase
MRATDTEESATAENRVAGKECIASPPATVNWYGDITCFEGALQRPKNESEVVAIMKDAQRYPSPVRPMGSRHSITACMVARSAEGLPRWGTAVDMTGFTRLADGSRIRVDKEAGTATFPAGCKYIDMARELRDRHALQFRVNTELGSFTMGAAACAATKDSAFPGEPGQVGSDVVAIRLVVPSGEALDFKQGDADFDVVSSSFGLLGIATEVTFRVVGLEDISIQHESLPVEDFASRCNAWVDGRTAVFLYLFPYAGRNGRIVAELRRKLPGRSPGAHSMRLALRNRFWCDTLPRAAALAHRMNKGLRAPALRGLDWAVRSFLAHGVNLRRVDPVDQIVDFDRGEGKFTFSMWALPAADFPQVLSEYFAFCREKHRSGYRTTMPHVSYRMGEDRSALLSYSYDGDIWTLDPVSTESGPGWHDFLRDFNERCSRWGGVPLFNQTPHLRREQVSRAYRERLAMFARVRQRFDPANRMLNEYFAELIAP